MKYDITALGEILIDFTPSGQGRGRRPCFCAKGGRRAG